MLKNILHSFLIRSLVALINFLVLIVSSRYLGVNSRGEISIFLLNIAVIQIINEIYTGYSLVYFLPKFNLKNIIVHGLIFTACFTVISNSVIVLLEKHVEGFAWASYLGSFLVLAHTFFCVIVLARQNVRSYNALSLLQPFLLLLLLSFLIFVVKIYTLHAYIYALLISFMVALLVSSVKTARIYLEDQRPEIYSFRSVFSKGLVYQLTVLMFIFINRYSYYLLNENGKIGLYATACSLMESVLLLAYGVAPVLLSRTANNRDPAGSSLVTIALAKLAFAFSLLLYLVLLIVPQRAFTFVMGEGFAAIGAVMIIYGPATIMQSVIIVMGSYFTGTGSQRTVLISYSAGFFCTLFLGHWLINSYGVFGAAITANISYLLVVCFIAFSFFSKEKMSLATLFDLRSDLRNIRGAIQAFKQG